MLEEFRRRILAASRERPLCLRGGGSKDFYGNEPRGEVLDTRGHAGIVSYEPTELVITARAGTPLAEIEATLAGQGQFLAGEPPCLRVGARTTRKIDITRRSHDGQTPARGAAGVAGRDRPLLPCTGRRLRRAR
jgi:FAD/FMN-containing dehydrogenase